MDARTPTLVALLCLAMLAPVLPTATAAADQAPYVNAGNDQTITESPFNCSDDADPETSPVDSCHYAVLDAQDCTVEGSAALSCDPDEDQQLKYFYRPTPGGCTYGPSFPTCYPLRDGSKFADFVSFPYSGAPTSGGYIKPQTPGCPAVDLQPGDEPGQARFEVPYLAPGWSTCVYSIDTIVYDSQPVPAQPVPCSPPGTCTATVDYTKDIDTVVVTVVSGPGNGKVSPPFFVGDFDVLLCPSSSTPDVNCSSGEEVDIVAHHGQVLRFVAEDIQDDKETLAVQVTLDREEGQSQLLVPLDHKTITHAWAITPGTPATGATPDEYEAANFYGELAIDTPGLIVGDYTVNARAWDREGGQGFLEDPPTVTVDDLFGTIGGEAYPCNVDYTTPGSPGSGTFGTNDPNADPGGTEPCIKNVDPDVGSKISINSCWDGVTNVPPQALGNGELLRPQIFFYWHDPNLDDPTISHVFDHDLWRWKVTYQSCVLGDDGSTAYGPQVELRSPYLMNLDTLFSGDQEVKLCAYNRFAEDPKCTVIPITTDTTKPTFLIDVPVTTYSGIPFQVVAYVQDRISTSATFHLNKLDFGPYNLRLAADAGPYTPLAFEATLPPLDEMLAIDIHGVNGEGPHDNSVTCDFLYDSDGDGLLDHYYDPMLHVVHALLPNVNAAGTGNDYIADDNDNGEGDVGEVILQYDPTDVVAGINLCLDPFADHPETRAFLEHAATQVFVYNLARKTLGSTRWTFAIQDQVSNRFADPSFAFRYPGMTTTHVSYLYGNLTTIEAVADVKVLDAAATSGPLLPGDRVDISASVTQETFLQPAPDLLVFIGLDERGDHSCADLDQNGLGDPCVALYCPPAAQLCAAIIASGASQPVVFVRPQAVDPSRIDTTGGTNPFSEIFPEALLRPDAAVWLASPYAAGRHSVNVTAFSFTSVTDLDLTNNQKVVDFEVYLGELVYGTYPAGQDPTGRTFYIRTSENHRLPRIDGGAVELNPDGSIKQAYSLILDETGTRYKFSFDDQGTEQTVTWDPQARWSRTFGKECSQLTDAEKAIDLAAVPPKDPQCRAITVVAPVAAPEEAAKSPSLQLEAGILVLGLAAFLARRRRA